MTVKFKSVKFKCDLRIYVLFYSCACAHIICTELPPNLNLPIFLFRPLGTKPPNLRIANISGYTGVQFGRNYCPKHKSSCRPLITIFVPVISQLWWQSLLHSWTALHYVTQCNLILHPGYPGKVTQLT